MINDNRQNYSLEKEENTSRGSHPACHSEEISAMPGRKTKMVLPSAEPKTILGDRKGICERKMWNQAIKIRSSQTATERMGHGNGVGTQRILPNPKSANSNPVDGVPSQFQGQG